MRRATRRRAPAAWRVARGKGARFSRSFSAAAADRRDLARSRGPAQIRRGLEPVEAAGQPELAGKGSLDFAAGCLWHRPRPQQTDIAGHDVVLGDDRLADLPDQLFGNNSVAFGPLDLLHDDELLAFVVVGHREGRAAMTAQCRVALLHRLLDILRVVVRAADNEDVLDAPG